MILVAHDGWRRNYYRTMKQKKSITVCLCSLSLPNSLVFFWLKLRNDIECFSNTMHENGWQKMLLVDTFGQTRRANTFEFFLLSNRSNGKLGAVAARFSFSPQKRRGMLRLGELKFQDISSPRTRDPRGSVFPNYKMANCCWCWIFNYKWSRVLVALNCFY